MIPLQKVKDIIIKYDNLEKELSSGSVNPKLFAKKIKGIFKFWKHNFSCKRIFKL